MHRLTLPVGTDDDPISGRYVLRPLHQSHAFPGQMIDHILVMDNRPQHHTRLTLLRRKLRHLHGSAHTVAKARRLGHFDGHTVPSFRAATPPIIWPVIASSSLAVGLRPS